MVSRTLVQFASKRVPLIRFRKGGHNVDAGAAAGSANQASSSPPAAKAPPAAGAPAKAAAGARPTIEDWELPPRYWRKPIDPVEMEYINRGGPA